MTVANAEAGFRDSFNDLRRMLFTEIETECRYTRLAFRRVVDAINLGSGLPEHIQKSARQALLINADRRHRRLDSAAQWLIVRTETAAERFEIVDGRTH